VIDIETERLILRLVPLAGLAATAANDRAACRRIIGPLVPDDWFVEAWVADMRLHQWKADPGYAPWSIRAIMLKDTGEIIGNMNCHDQPRLFQYDGQRGLAKIV
jgi:[ribosomal protein S5]-alanine N-acetyltransferase